MFTWTIWSPSLCQMCFNYDRPGHLRDDIPSHPLRLWRFQDGLTSSHAKFAVISLSIKNTTVWGRTFFADLGESILRSFREPWEFFKTQIYRKDEAQSNGCTQETFKTDATVGTISMFGIDEVVTVDFWHSDCQYTWLPSPPYHTWPLILCQWDINAAGSKEGAYTITLHINWSMFGGIGPWRILSWIPSRRPRRPTNHICLHLKRFLTLSNVWWINISIGRLTMILECNLSGQIISLARTYMLEPIMKFK